MLGFLKGILMITFLFVAIVLFIFSVAFAKELHYNFKRGRE